MPNKPVLLLHFLNLVLRPRTGQNSANQPDMFPQHPFPTDHEAWRIYWQAQGQPWRTEPEIEEKRQEYLTKRCKIAPDIEQGIYPFKDVKLNRADIEWLLATHENGRGPVDWRDESQREREGLDLRGACLNGMNLRTLPLARLRGALGLNEYDNATEEQRNMAAVFMEGTELIEAHLEGANLKEAHLQKAKLIAAHLEEANLQCAYLQKADLGWANLEEALLWDAHLERACLLEAHLERAYLGNAHLEGADLSEAHLEGAFLKNAHLEGANLELAYLENVRLDDANLSDVKHIGPLLADVHWIDVNLSVVKWSQMNMLGEEHKAQQRKLYGKMKDKSTRLNEFERATRANRQLAIALQAQGLNEEAVRFAYRAQVLQKQVFWFQMLQKGAKLRQRVQAFGAWLFSWFLYLLAGYGYRLGRSFLAYLMIICLFMTLYHVLDPHLAWNEAFVVSMTAFHGRGFSPSTFTPGDPLSFASAAEAFVGLIIEVTFIATLTQRFFNR
jgi:uncharacterized protein YjbI with pentapeptide repeats